MTQYSQLAEMLINNADPSELEAIIDGCDKADLLNLMLEHKFISELDIIRELDPNIAEIIDEKKEFQRKAEVIGRNMAKIKESLDQLILKGEWTVDDLDQIRKLTKGE